MGDAGRFLDITGDVCPMTFVRTRLRIEKMAPGEILEIRLAGEEPLRNVPDSLAELGHEILSLAAEDGPAAAGGRRPHRLVVRKASPGGGATSRDIVTAATGGPRRRG